MFIINDKNEYFYYFIKIINTGMLISIQRIPCKALPPIYLIRENLAGSIKEADWACTQMPDQPIAKAARAKPPIPVSLVASDTPAVTSNKQLTSVSREERPAVSKRSVKMLIRTEKNTTNPQTSKTALTASFTAAGKSRR